jgi:hypothetical protein
MYQDNPIPASLGGNFFQRNRTWPNNTAVLSDFLGLLLGQLRTAKCQLLAFQFGFLAIPG